MFFVLRFNTIGFLKNLRHSRIFSLYYNSIRFYSYGIFLAQRYFLCTSIQNNWILKKNIVTQDILFALRLYTIEFLGIFLTQGYFLCTTIQNNWILEESSSLKDVLFLLRLKTIGFLRNLAHSRIFSLYYD